VTDPAGRLSVASTQYYIEIGTPDAVERYASLVLAASALREDPRFIEADGILADLEADQNPMTMEWQDVEVLVRDLFEAMLSERGAEVKVTRTSRDQGVDAVVFDPDPLMGGRPSFKRSDTEAPFRSPAVRELDGANLLHLLQNHGVGYGST
jgi:hypothetical protein